MKDATLADKPIDALSLGCVVLILWFALGPSNPYVRAWWSVVCVVPCLVAASLLVRQRMNVVSLADDVAAKFVLACVWLAVVQLFFVFTLDRKGVIDEDSSRLLVEAWGLAAVIVAALNVVRMHSRLPPWNDVGASQWRKVDEMWNDTFANPNASITRPREGVVQVIVPVSLVYLSIYASRLVEKEVMGSVLLGFFSVLACVLVGGSMGFATIAWLDRGRAGTSKLLSKTH